MGHFHEHMPSYTFRITCTAVCSGSKVGLEMLIVTNSTSLRLYSDADRLDGYVQEVPPRYAAGGGQNAGG